MTTIVRHLLTSRGFHISLAVFLLGLYSLRIMLFPGASEDDAEQLFFAQSLAGGYKPAQPPLYTWLVYAAFQITGVALPVVLAIKFAALAAIYALSYRIARLMSCEEGWAAFAGFSVFGFYYIGWDSVINYSQTVLMAALCLAAIHGLMRIANDKTDWGSFLYLGLVIGMGLMSKYNFAIYLVALLGAALMDQDLRARLLGIKGVVALLLAGLVSVPHGLWLLNGNVGPAEISDAMTQTDIGAWSARLSGLADMLDAVVSILSPLLIMFVVFFPRAFLPIKNDNPGRRLLERGGLIVLGLMALLIVITGMSAVRNHWFIVLIGFSVYGTLRISSVYPDLDAKRVGWFITLLVVLAGVVVAVLGVKAMRGADGCRKCRLIVPFSELADQLRDAGFESGTILTFDYPTQIGGNLRRYFPDSRIISARFRTYEPPRPSTPGKEAQCLAVWHLDSSQSPKFEIMKHLLKSRLAVEINGNEQMQIAEVPLDGWFDKPGTHVMRFGYTLIEQCG